MLLFVNHFFSSLDRVQLVYFIHVHFMLSDPVQCAYKKLFDLRTLALVYVTSFRSNDKQIRDGACAIY